MSSSVFVIGRQQSSSTMTASGKTTGCCTCTKRKLLILVVTLCVFTLLCYVLREKYFFRADVLVAISSRVDNTNGNDRSESFKTIDESNKKSEDSGEGGVLSFLGFGNSKKKKVSANDGGAGKLNVWDAWMKQNKHYSSIGDIYNKCGKNS